MIYLWRLGSCILCIAFWSTLLVPPLKSGEKEQKLRTSTQLVASNLSGSHRKSLPMPGTVKYTDDTFEHCSRTLPDPVLRLIAQYCIGTKADGVCPLLVKSLCWNRVIAYASNKIDTAAAHINVCGDGPRFMMLCDYRSPAQSRAIHRSSLPIINTFNFETGEHLLHNYEVTASASRISKLMLPHNGTLVRWTTDFDESADEIVFMKHIEYLIPQNQVLPSEERRLTSQECAGMYSIGGLACRWESAMNYVFLGQTNGALYARWVFGTPAKMVQLKPDPEKEILNLQQRKLWLIASDDRECIGIVFPQSIVLFDGTTGAELMRCVPPLEFSFHTKCTLEEEGLTSKIQTIPVRGEKQSRYELIALVTRRKLLYTEDQYVRWDIDEKRRTQSTCIRKGYSGTIGCDHILTSGSLVTMYNDTDKQLITCDPGVDTIRPLWRAGKWNEFGDGGYSMYVTKSGSHVVLYGRSRATPGPDKSSYAFCATLLHFDPTALYESDVSGVTDSSLLQRIRLLNGLCLAASENEPVALTAQGKKLFAQLHSHVRRNLQTTMPHVHGWDDEPDALKSRVPILPSFKEEEKRTEQKARTGGLPQCKTQ